MLIEAKQRTAISRAYYGAFCVARDFIVENNLTTIPNNAEAHLKVKEFYKDSEDVNYKKVGANLDRLRINRNDADYKNTYTNINKLECLKNILYANEIMEVLSKTS
ncbi:MAG: DNA-binding protein [Bacillota bacterium]